MRIVRTAIVATTAVFCLVSLASAALCCPFCSAPSLTLAEQLAQSDAAVLVQWVEGTKPTGEKAGKTVYEIRQILRSPKSSVKKGERVTLARFRAGKKGDLFMLMGTKGTIIEWGSPLEVSETSYNYIAQAPSPETAATKRLAYFLKFLEFPDQMISNDAYAEFANAPYKDITAASKSMPRDKIRKWITDKDTPATRVGLYGLMLGLCGNKDDAALMEAKINEKTEDFRLGIDGVISGYLLLTGEKGLDVIDQAKLKNKKIPFSETYASMQALRFMWTYGGEKIGKERLRKSMRVLLDRPELADLVIADLARWKDWKVLDQMMELYGAEEYNIPSIKRAIVRYMLVCSKDTPSGDNVTLPKHVVAARAHLETLRKKDAKTVREAERFFFIK